LITGSMTMVLALWCVSASAMVSIVSAEASMP
jgi:hypothetical protein